MSEVLELRRKLESMEIWYARKFKTQEELIRTMEHNAIMNHQPHPMILSKDESVNILNNLLDTANKRLEPLSGIPNPAEWMAEMKKKLKEVDELMNEDRLSAHNEAWDIIEEALKSFPTTPKEQ